jgi:uncharacterized membrane protein YdjX (TVP38/TMEM64 family)
MTHTRETRLTRRRKALLALVILVAGGLTALALARPDLFTAEHFRKLGYLGVFLFAFLGSSTVVFPIPHLAFTFTMGSMLPPLLVGLTAGLGDALGELWGYLLGYSLEAKLRSLSIYPRVRGWMERNGVLTVFLLALFPVPFFDVAGVIGGSMGFPVWKFFGAAWTGKTIKSLLFAWGGYHSLGWLMGGS